MRRISVIAALVGAALVAVGDGPAPARTAPNFSAKGSDGRAHTLKSLTNGKTLVLYFISATCPVNAEAMPFFKQIGEAYKGQVNFYGVINEDEAGYKVWKKEFGNRFSVLYDKDLEIIRSYEAIASPWVVVVNPKGEVAMTQKGFSASSLAQLNSHMAQAGGVSAAKLDLTGAPADMSYG